MNLIVKYSLLLILKFCICVGITRAQIPSYLNSYQKIYDLSPKEASLAWFDDARLGMFIHWGVWGKFNSAFAIYSNRIPLEDYQQIARETNASEFDAKEIVKLAEDSGMRYITFVSKHADGFTLWNSQATGWDSFDYLKRDFVAELSEACQEKGMPLFFYYCVGIDWTHPYFIPRELYQIGRPNYAETPAHFKYRNPEDFDIYRKFVMQQLTELCTNYGPVAGFWFDPLGGVLANSELFNMQEFYDLIHEIQPHALILFKTGITGTEDVLVGERELRSISSFYASDNPEDKRIAKLADEAWQRNMGKKAEIAVTSQRNWEWSPENPCMDVDGLWNMLKGAAENNANLLLNFGPKPDGSIPEDVAVNFRLLGDRIRMEGYPPLNKITYMDLRKRGTYIDKTEINKTAR